jgi:lysophospholipase L1-like esterase
MSTIRSVPARDESCRQVLRSTSGGLQLRLRLSNALSPTALTLTAVTVGIRNSGPAVDAPLPVLVGGSTRVVIPPGDQVTTDPVAMVVPPGADVAVSFAVSGTARLSEHAVGAATGWCTGPGTGDHTRESAGSAYRIASREALVVEDLEVDGSGSGPRGILAVGDSLTDPPLPPDSYQRWTDEVARRLPGRAVANVGIGGNRIVLSGGYGPTLTQRFARDVIARSGAGTLVLFAGTNDVSTGISAARLIARLTVLCNQASAVGLRVVLVTLAPAEHRASDRERTRQEVNSWIRSTHSAALHIDADALLRDPSRPTRLLPSYDLGDGLHLSALGHRRLGQAIAAALLRH